MSTMGWSGCGRTAERMSAWLMCAGSLRRAELSRLFCRAGGNPDQLRPLALDEPPSPGMSATGVDGAEVRTRFLRLAHMPDWTPIESMASAPNSAGVWVGIVTVRTLFSPA